MIKFLTYKIVQLQRILFVTIVTLTKERIWQNMKF